MKRVRSPKLWLLTCLICVWVTYPGVAQRALAPTHTFTVQGRQFLLDGKPFQVIAGDMEYPRIPRPYWRDRMRKARAMGLNTISMYAFWNLHEPRPGVYEFSGQNDIAEYIREAQQEGLYVIFRPGPYVCAEWELGGYPSWLLKDRSLVLRSEDPKYTAAVSVWFKRLGQEIEPLLLKNGGPIIAVQVENEYGSFNGASGDSHVYLEGVKAQITSAGMGETLLYTGNQAGDLSAGSLPELTSVANFGSGDAARSFARLKEFRPDGPRMVGEYWAGWFDKWGEKHHETDGNKEAAELKSMLADGDSVSIYMFHGGTNFGWMNGADTHTGSDYHPDTTSYDYDAPLDEKGDPRSKYFLFRQVIAQATHQQLPPVPEIKPLQNFEMAPITGKTLTASLWRSLPAPVRSEMPLTFEDLDQAFGYVLYRTALNEGDGGKLVLEGLHDYAQVYVDQVLVGTLDRRLGTDALEIPRQTHAATLDILVENTGRVNYSKTIRTERTGLTGGVTLGGKEVRNWENFSLPLNDLSRLQFTADSCAGPCFFQVSMRVPRVADTYIDTRGLHKGQLWIGDHNLGRFWSVGPQYALYAPGPWLKTGTTTLTFFDLLADSTERLSTSTEPIFGAVTGSREAQ